MMSATDNDLQVSTTECKVAFATAEYKLADGRVCVHSRTHLRDRSRPHISAALPVHTIISSPGGKEGDSSWLSVTPVPRTSSGPLRRMRQLKLHACVLSASCNSYTKLLADLHVELRSLLSLLTNWQADQFCIIRTPTLREVITVKIVRIIMEFLQYCTMNKSYKTCRYY